MNSNTIKISNKKIFTIFTLLYFSLLLGFYLDENLAGGAIFDFNYHIPILNSFKDNLSYSFLNYKDFNSDHSPFFFIFLNLINMPFEGTNFLRFIYLHISLIVPIVFYKCLIEAYKDCSKKILILISCIILISPHFRSYAIWIGDVNIALLFLLTSVLFFLKLKNEKQIHKIYSYIFLNVFCFAIAAYFRPIYSLISIYFLYQIFLKFNVSKKLLIFISLNILLSLPAFYYVFVLDNIFFTVIPSFFNNPTIHIYANNIMITSTIFLFYSLPFLWINKNNLLFKKFFFNKKELLIILLSFVFTIFLIYNFNFTSDGGGGGIFYKASQLIFKNNSFFYIVSFLSITLLLKVFFDKNINNILLILILIGFDPDYFVYHKTYDPILFCFFLLLVENLSFYKLSKNNQKKLTFNLYVFYILIFLMYIFIRTVLKLH
jgi:hypothetical protein